MYIVAYDLETTDLKGLMGRTLCCSFLPILHPDKEPEPYTFRLDQAPYKAKDPIDDSKLCVAIREELEKYHLMVGWNSKLFDKPFLNARLMKVGERPIESPWHLDLMYYARGISMRIGSSKLVNVQKFLGLEEEKTDIEWDEWNRAALYDKDAMDAVALHCEMDVMVLAEAYWRMLPLVRNIHR
jgi:uncharacterized protein YprB with RNaseH-like and TPR domain